MKKPEKKPDKKTPASADSKKRTKTPSDSKKRAKTLSDPSNTPAKRPKTLPDPMAHFDHLLQEEESQRLLSKDSMPETKTTPTPFGRSHIPTGLTTLPSPVASLDDVKQSLRDNVLGDWSPQEPFWQALHSYQVLNLTKVLDVSDPVWIFFKESRACLLLGDIHYPVRGRSREGSEREVEMVCLHVLNHALKLRARILGNNERLKKTGGEDSEVRDQGLTRPKTLILLPFRSAALRYVETLARLMFGKATKEFVTNKKRFMDEFAVGEEEPVRDKPRDFQELFAGNSDDCFRLGIGIAKKSLKLFVDFYSADIIIASPLGLRMVVGAEGESSHEFDFLSSLHVLVLDQADVFLMQNWSHVLHIMDHLHRTPREAHGTDLSRVHLWELNGWARLYRQTLLLASHPTPELRALHSRYGRNYAGLAEWSPVFPAQGLLPALSPSLSQVFHRFSAPDLASAHDARFTFFLAKVLPRFLSTGLSHTAVFVPSYLDFVRLRNHFKRETLGSVQVSEYTKPGKVARARDLFFHGTKPFLLYSERAHFFKRHHLRGIRQLIFYQLPLVSDFYAELADLVAESAEGGEGVQGRLTVLYCAQDALRLAPVLGPARAKALISSDDSTFALTS